MVASKGFQTRVLCFNRHTNPCDSTRSPVYNLLHRNKSDTRNLKLTITLSPGSILIRSVCPVAPRAYWKGYLKLSLVSCPISLFPAASEREKKISF
jgi:hypothetical protein